MPHIEIIEVTSYLFGRINHAVQIEIRSVRKRREDLRQHCTLDSSGYLEFPQHALLLVIGYNQILDISPADIHDENQQGETKQHQEGNDQTYMPQIRIENIFRNNNRQMPPRGVNLFVKNHIFAARHSVRTRNDIHSRGGAYGIITILKHLQVFRHSMKTGNRQIYTNDRHNTSILIFNRMRATNGSLHQALSIVRPLLNHSVWK